MSQEVIVIVALVIFGLVFGFLTARSSHQRDTVHGGMMAQFFQYIASALWATLTPTVLTSVIVLDVPLLQALLIAVAMLAIAFLATLLHAVFEKPALDKLEQEDRGWTAQDAVSSGL
jgi:cobalamin synthase